jgi:hypothetical protein
MRREERGRVEGQERGGEVGKRKEKEYSFIKL